MILFGFAFTNIWATLNKAKRKETEILEENLDKIFFIFMGERKFFEITFGLFVSLRVIS